MTWPGVPLGEAGDWLSGGTPSKRKAELWDGPLPWVSPKDMKRSRIADAIDHVSEAAVGNGTRLLPPEAILIVVRGMILAHTFPVALTTAPVTFNQDIKALLPDARFEPEFLLHWLQNKAPEMLRLVTVSNHGTKRLPTESLFSVDVPTPPLPEQRKIAAILSSVDDAIEKSQAVIDQLGVVKQAMMAELLTRGLPGRHKRFKKTEIGEIPESWQLERLGDLCIDKPQYGANVKKGEFDPVLPRYVRITDIDENGDLRTDDPVSISEREAVPYILEPGDLLFARSGATVGKTYLYDRRDGRCAYAGYLIRFRVDSKRMRPGFLRYVVQSPRYWQWIADVQRAQAQPNVNAKEYGTFVVQVPSIEEQDKLTEVLSALDERRRREEAKAAGSQTVKAALMNVLLTGELRVTPDEEAA